MTAALSVAPEANYIEPVVGWRCWRILPFERLDSSSTYRLCAVGTFGIPKLWQPRQANVAVCSAFKSDHEAPWPGHECGIWAFDRREDAFRRMVVWMQTQGRELAGWACGQVSLWGRVVEHEKGWRAQFAYPYTIEVEAHSASVAETIRDEYAIDVAWKGSATWAKAKDKQAGKNEAEAATLRAGLKEVRADLAAIASKLREPSTPAPSRSVTDDYRKVPYDLKSDAYIAAVRRAVEKSKHGAVTGRAVTDELAKGPAGARLWHGDAISVGVRLANIRLGGRVEQLTRGGKARKSADKGGLGQSLWTLPGIKISEELSAWAEVEDRMAPVDEAVYNAARSAISDAGRPVTTREIVERMGDDYSNASRRTTVGLALYRLVWRETIRKADRVGSVQSWALA
jgi:hypothetical protein